MMLFSWLGVYWASEVEAQKASRNIRMILRAILSLLHSERLGKRVYLLAIATSYDSSARRGSSIATPTE